MGKHESFSIASFGSWVVHVQSLEHPIGPPHAQEM